MKSFYFLQMSSYKNLRGWISSNNVKDNLKKTTSDLKVFKAKDIQDAYGFEIFFSFDFLVNLKDDPGETLGI